MFSIRRAFRRNGSFHRKKYSKAAGKYVIDRQLLEHMKKDAMILHPLPRAGEIDPEVDADPRAAYFRQAQNGLYIRMAVIEKCLADQCNDREEASRAADVTADWRLLHYSQVQWSTGLRAAAVSSSLLIIVV